MTGPAGAAPQMPGVQIADLAGGALWSATAILAALVGRQRTGKGAHLDISMTEGALALLAAELGNLDCGAHPTRGVETLNGGLACYGVYRTKDDRYLAVGALEPKFWVTLNQSARPRAASARRAAPAQSAASSEALAPISRRSSRPRSAAEWHARARRRQRELLRKEIVTESSPTLPDHPLHQRASESSSKTDGGPGVGEIYSRLRTPLGAPTHARRHPPASASTPPKSSPNGGRFQLKKPGRSNVARSHDREGRSSTLLDLAGVGDPRVESASRSMRRWRSASRRRSWRGPARGSGRSRRRRCSISARH